MKLKKFLLTVLTLALLVSASACNFNTDISFGEPEVPTADIDKPTEEVTQLPTEEPTEKPTEPIITIDGITFDKSLKSKLNAAKTYADVCEILGKEGTLVEHPEVVYYWDGTIDSKIYRVYIKFKASDESYVICEDVSVTMNDLGVKPSIVPQEVLEQLTIGMTFEEADNIIPGKNTGIFTYGMPIVYEWEFNADTKISVEFGHSPYRSKDQMYILHIALWDYESTKTVAEINRDKLQLGQTIAELNELLGTEGEDAAQGGIYWWDFEDGTRLRIGYILDFSDTSLPIEERMRFNGHSYIYQSP